MVEQNIVTFEDILKESENVVIKRDLKCLVFFMREELGLNACERREFFDSLKSSGMLYDFVRYSSDFKGYKLVKLYEDDPFKAFYE